MWVQRDKLSYASRVICLCSRTGNEAEEVGKTVLLNESWILASQASGRVHHFKRVLGGIKV